MFFHTIQVLRGIFLFISLFFFSQNQKMYVRISKVKIVWKILMIFKKTCAFLFLALSTCTSSQNGHIVPGIVPSSQQTPKIKYIRPNNIIGEIEPLYMLPMKSAFLARVDTGATTSSIDVEKTEETSSAAPAPAPGPSEAVSEAPADNDDSIEPGPTD